MNPVPVRPNILDIEEGCGGGQAVGADASHQSVEDHVESRDRGEGDKHEDDAIPVDDREGDEEYGDRKQKVGRQPDAPTKADRDAHFPSTSIIDRGVTIASVAGQLASNTGGRQHLMKA